MKSGLLTGGTRGIGKAILKTFLDQGFTMFTCGKNPDSVNQLKEDFSDFVSRGQLFVELVDVAQKDALQKWIGSVLAIQPVLDLLINNAGVFLPGSIAEEADGTFETMIQTNLASAYHTTRAALPGLLQSPKAHIFTVCSTASITAYTNGGSYCISKFGLLGMSKVLREELKPKGIAVTSILPGATQTDSWAGSGLPDSRFMQPEDVAKAIWSAWNLSPGCVMEEILMRPMEGDI
jgi:NADP-dependent 3-hydroxy acid dehydrogenase YdfG